MSLGGRCDSTGPSSLDPADNERYATRLLILTVYDMSISAASLYQDYVNHLISISVCARSQPYSIALRHTQRQVLMADSN
ncbi:hypothetical protein BC941DRAFT_476428 [Chlamydoabsidia padenii]|nr:hypothetical protein BC941DRAFT_476428 [Chlamydoabsidia padenii]